MSAQIPAISPYCLWLLSANFVVVFGIIRFSLFFFGKGLLYSFSTALVKPRMSPYIEVGVKVPDIRIAEWVLSITSFAASEGSRHLYELCAWRCQAMLPKTLQRQAHSSFFAFPL